MRTVSSQRALKVFFQTVSDVEGLLHQGKTSFSLEDLELPRHAFAEIDRVLNESNAMLPLSARTFREWRVGLLDRFERMKSGGE